mgnify:CR=1 FL=1
MTADLMTRREIKTSKRGQNLIGERRNKNAQDDGRDYSAYGRWVQQIFVRTNEKHFDQYLKKKKGEIQREEKDAAKCLISHS